MCLECFPEIQSFISQCAQAIDASLEGLLSLIELFAGMQEVTMAYRGAGLHAAALDVVVHRRACDLRRAAGMAWYSYWVRGSLLFAKHRKVFF